jgi:hypothetical protein
LSRIIIYHPFLRDAFTRKPWMILSMPNARFQIVVFLLVVLITDDSEAGQYLSLSDWSNSVGEDRSGPTLQN